MNASNSGQPRVEFTLFHMVSIHPKHRVDPLMLPSDRRGGAFGADRGDVEVLTVKVKVEEQFIRVPLKQVVGRLN